MVEDHVQIDRWLDRSERPDGSIDADAYTRFRHDLLRHIGMEEKVLLPHARSMRAGRPWPLADSLHADHGEIARLLVRTPTPSVVAALRELLGKHNALEEGSDGLYAECDALAGEEAPAIVERLRAQPAVPLAKYYDGPSHRQR
jgi:hypothetical protein